MMILLILFTLFMTIMSFVVLGEIFVVSYPNTKFNKWWRKYIIYNQEEYDRNKPPYVSDNFQIGPEGAYEHVETELDFDKIIQQNFEGLKDFIKDKDVLAFYHDLIKHSIKYYAQEMIYPAEKVTRFEVIDHTKEMRGRAYVKYNIEVELSFQDDGQTLKVFVNDKIC